MSAENRECIAPSPIEPGIVIDVEKKAANIETVFSDQNISHFVSAIHDTNPIHPPIVPGFQLEAVLQKLADAYMRKCHGDEYPSSLMQSFVHTGFQQLAKSGERLLFSVAESRKDGESMELQLGIYKVADLANQPGGRKSIICNKSLIKYSVQPETPVSPAFQDNPISSCDYLIGSYVFAQYSAGLPFPFQLSDLESLMPALITEPIINYLMQKKGEFEGMKPVFKNHTITYHHNIATAVNPEEQVTVQLGEVFGSKREKNRFCFTMIGYGFNSKREPLYNIIAELEFLPERVLKRFGFG
ncbi:MAG: hypothetical protein V1743_06260 [Nanoarchaeota archaeon]